MPYLYDFGLKVLSLKNFILLFVILSVSAFSMAQDITVKNYSFSRDTIHFDSVSVYQTGFQIKLDGKILPPSYYQLNKIHSWVLIDGDIEGEKLELNYYPMPLDFSQNLKHKSKEIIIPDTIKDVNPYIYSVSKSNPNKDLFGSTKLNKYGSISRGVTVGNAQNLSFQSTLNLQLDGQIAPNLYMKGSISDDNIPFQPEGNTQKLQEFDQVYLKVYNDDFAVIGGDFWLRKPTGYFLNYAKRTQGISVEGNHSMELLGFDGQAKHKVSAAFSRGKFSRNIIQGVEGNQGPYRLTGAENETFIVILAGTEKVWIDGQLLKRGQEFDYIIDYNTAQITFTANQLITKDKRIIVEFQYSDLNYARSLVAYEGDFEGKRYHAWVNVYSEQDAKNQTIQQTLTNEKKNILAAAGDSLNDAFANSIDSVGFFDSRVLYSLIDTMGYDSVLLFTVNPDSALYQASFTLVGENNGNYVFDKFTSNGRVYRWVAPVAGVPQGDYEPIRLLVAPQKKQMYVAGAEFKLSKGIKTSAEVALSNFDQNTFSDLHAQDNEGVGLKWKWISEHPLGKKEEWMFSSKADFEFQGNNFQPIQWFRSPEFDRDWNVRHQNFNGHQYLSTAGLKLGKKELGSLAYDFQNFIWGDDYTGFRNNLNLRMKKKGFRSKLDASYLSSDGLEKTTFLRHMANISQDIKFFKVGFEDIHEDNRRYISGDPTLQLTSYRFYDWKAYVSTLDADSTKNQLELYYRERYDWFSDSVSLKQATRAQNVGFIAGLLKNPAHTVRLNLNYRKLDVLDTNLFQNQAENTILNRLEHGLKLWKGALTTTTFYELGSGLELKREFVYVQVNPGQGSYTWNDYNGDGVKDLGEFEIAIFQDQGEYIRVFIPTNSYIRTYSNQFSTSVFLRPERLWRSKKGALKFFSRFSDQVIYKINRKTNYEEGFEAFNPFVYAISDTNLVSISSTFRNTFYFNKTNSVFGANYSYQENGSKILLSSGFDSRLHTFHEGRIRWNLSKYYNLRLNGILGRKKSSSDYTTGRDYFIEYFEIEPTFSYQPGSKFRVALKGKYTEKANNSDLGEKAIIRDVGIEMRLNQAQKGSFTAQFNYIIIDYNASTNTSLAFEMLEGLKTGNNFTWGVTYQRKVAKNLQLNFTYNGRKSEGNSTIHTGGMELRAFF